jgi:hypothetical protein
LERGMGKGFSSPLGGEVARSAGGDAQFGKAEKKGLSMRPDCEEGVTRGLVVE